jgi:hypothetical protein
MPDENAKYSHKFPYELLVQIYNQRVQILWFAIAFSLAFLGAFYSALVDPYTGDEGKIPFLVMVFGFAITYGIFLFECRNHEIQSSDEAKLEGYLKTFNGVNLCDSSVDLRNNKKFALSYARLINFLFSVLYFVEGISISTCFLLININDLKDVGWFARVTSNLHWIVILILSVNIFIWVIVPSKVCQYKKTRFNFYYIYKNSPSLTSAIGTYLSVKFKRSLSYIINKFNAIVLYNLARVFLFVFFYFFLGACVASYLVSPTWIQKNELNVNLVDNEEIIVKNQNISFGFGDDFHPDGKITILPSLDLETNPKIMQILKPEIEKVVQAYLLKLTKDFQKTIPTEVSGSNESKINKKPKNKINTHPPNKKDPD